MKEYFGEYDGFDVNDDFGDESYFFEDDDDDYFDEDWQEDFYEDDFDDEDFEDEGYVDGYAATAVFPVIDSEEKAKKQADDWLDYAQYIFDKEEESEIYTDDPSETFSQVEINQDYFLYG